MSHLITFMNLSILSDFGVTKFCTSGSLSVLKVLDALKGKSEVSEAHNFSFGILSEQELDIYKKKL